MLAKNYFKNNLFKSFEEFENSLIDSNFTTKEKGDIFEKFNELYFIFYQERYNISEVWFQVGQGIPVSIKDKLKLESDHGVDGVIETIDGRLYTCQTKFRSDKKSATSNEFKKLAAETYASGKASGMYIFQNSFTYPDNLRKHKPLTVLRDEFLKLDSHFFESIHKIEMKEKLPVKEFLTPYSYQERAINNIINGFKSNDRGQYISACGTGKTLTSLWIKEKGDYGKTLFIVPSIQLIKQTLENWIDQRKKSFKFLCICSDNDIGDIDSIDEDAGALGILSTTKHEEIKIFLDENLDEDIVIFSTYQSLDKLSNTAKEMNFEFDITFFDEAHRTAGPDKQIFSNGLKNNFLKSKKRLFMTATPKIITRSLKSRIIEEFFSMDELKDYGPVFETFSFREAIDEGAIVDFDIVIMCVNRDDTNEMTKLNDFSTFEGREISNQDIALSISIEKLMSDDNFNVNKAILFSNTINKANEQIKNLKFDWLKDVFGFMSTISSKQPMETRKEILSEFASSKKGIISNARCLTEGIDVPDVDCVIFSERKSSIIDLVQSTGRALRKNRENPDKRAKIYIPIYFDQIENNALNLERYEYMFEIIESLKAHDTNLVEEINSIAVGGGIGESREPRIQIRTYNNVNTDIVRKLILPEIAQLNRGTIEILKKEFSNSEKNANKTLSPNLKIYRYKIASWKKLVKKSIHFIGKTPTPLNLVKENIIKSNGQEDNNFFKASENAGLIIRDENKNVYLTEEGIGFINNEISFEECLKNVFTSKNEINLYPYNAIIKILNSVSVNDIQFMYSIYLMKDVSDNEIDKSIKVIKKINSLNIDWKIILSNEKALKKTINELNNIFSERLEYFEEHRFSERDFLGKTRCKAELRYITDHLNLINKSYDYDSFELKKI